MDTKSGQNPTPTPPQPSRAYQPHVPSAESPLEFTLKAVIAGILFGILFGAANAYLGLRAGLTISTSIPVAVMTVAVFRVFTSFGVSHTILEANLSQTVGSASSSLASGVIFTLPALFLWELDPPLAQMTLLAMAGGLLGVLFMIPLRGYLIEGEHGRLPYPEGTACAEVLVASQTGGDRAQNVFWGLGAGALTKVLYGWVKLLPDDVHFRVPLLKKGELGLEMSAALLGVGYILGPRIAGIMVGGSLLSWLVIIPAMAWWGEGRPQPLYPETLKTISEMTAPEIWTRYVRYIGAGAVATAGLITLIRSIPTMVRSFRLGAQQLRRGLRPDSPPTVRTKRDLPFLCVLAGAALIAVTIATLPYVFGPSVTPLVRAVGAILIVISAFFFVTVSSRIVGLVGVTSNPTSGMTIATLLMTSSVFLWAGWTDDMGKATALTVGCVVAIAASIAGDTSQDLKTGFLLGATPYRQQTGELVGVLTSAAFVCMAVLLLDHSYGFGTAELPAPQATLMKVVIEGVLESSLPWGLVGMGIVIALAAEACRIPSLPFAVGVYLPLTTPTTVFVGGCLRLLLERNTPPAAAATVREKGVLFGSGLVGGEGLVGVGIAGLAFLYEGSSLGVGPNWAGWAGPWLAAAAFAWLTWFFYRRAKA